MNSAIVTVIIVSLEIGTNIRINIVIIVIENIKIGDYPKILQKQ